MTAFLPSRPWTVMIVMAMLLLPLPCANAQTRQAGDAYLAAVNGVPITRQDLDEEQYLLQQEMRLQGDPLTEDRLQGIQERLLETLIEREVLHQHAQARNIQVRAQWVDESMALLRGRVGGASQLQTLLADGAITRERLRERIRKGLAIQQLLQREALRGVRVTDTEMLAFHRDNPDLFQGEVHFRARHLLVTVSDWSNEALRLSARQRIERFQEDIDGGTPLAVLALEHSDCPSRTRGGDLGYLPATRMVTEITDVITHLTPGQISDIVPSPFGYHLFQLVDRRPAEPVTYTKARAKIERTLRRDKEHAALQTFTAGLKRRADIAGPEAFRP